MKATEVDFEIHGRKLTGKRWGKEGGIPTLALHGWLDNANSFDLIAPQLPELDLFALDFAGHGLSDHRPRHTPYIGTLDIQDVICVANQLNWEKFNLLAHSMGSELSTHIIGLYPDRVERLLGIDGFAESTNTARWLTDTRKSIDDNLTRHSGQMRVFSSQEKMANRVSESTGQSVESARVLVARGSKQVEEGFSWRSDPRVRWSDALCLPHDQVNDIVASYPGKILIVSASEGSNWYQSTVEQLAGKFDNIELVILKGSHHLHMDADTTQLVDTIRRFFCD